MSPFTLSHLLVHSLVSQVGWGCFGRQLIAEMKQIAAKIRLEISFLGFVLAWVVLAICRVQISWPEVVARYRGQMVWHETAKKQPKNKQKTPTVPKGGIYRRIIR